MLHRYRRVLGAPHVLPLVLASVLARAPIGMVSLALVLYVEELTGSFASAGVVTASFAIAAGLASPLQGRLIDRLGQTRVLPVAAGLNATMTVGLVVLGEAGAGPALLAVAAALVGAGVPPISASLRPLWPGLLGDEALLPAAYALDSILIEAVFALGPLLTAAFVAALAPSAALLAAAAAVLAGTLWFAALPPSRAWRGEPGTAGWAGPLHAPGMRTLLLAGVGAGGLFGTFEVAMPAFGEAHGSAGFGGPLITAWALGSALGAVIYGALAERLGALWRAFLRLAIALPLVSLVTLLAPSTLAMIPLVALAGLCIAPMQAAQNQLIGEVAPAGTITEAYTWVLMGLVVGVSAGNVVAGALADGAGWRASILAGCAMAAAGAAVAWVRRSTLQRSAVPIR